MIGVALAVPDFIYRKEAIAIAAAIPLLFGALFFLNRFLLHQRILGMSLRRIDRMEGEEFEQWVAEVFRLRGWRVEEVGGSGDYGIDLIGTRRGWRWGIQVKRHSDKVSNSAVQEARAGADYHDCDHAAVVTNSHFTTAARRQAEKMKPPVVLVDREDLHSVAALLDQPPE